MNLLYQYWIHTETVGALGPAEEVLNTPSHHRVHHGSNRQYLDRNHGSILIVWDRLFGTFEPEGERVVYGLTKNINTFQPGRIATHEYAAMLRDVAASTSWSERLSYIVRGPGWANDHRAERAARRRHRRAGVDGPSPSPSTRPRGPRQRLRPGRVRRMGHRITPMNVLLVTLDQFRGDCLSAAGHPVVRTPNLDRLAGDGVRLARHYSQAAPCGPGRACLYTGTYQLNNRVVGNGTPLDFRFDNVARAARRAGYVPTVFGYADQGIDPRTATGPDDPRLSHLSGVPARASTSGSTCPTSRTPGARGSSVSATTCPPTATPPWPPSPTVRPSTACPPS